MYNYLHIDPWYEDSVYFMDCKGRVLNLTVTLDTALGKPREVFRMAPEPSLCEERLCASLSLTSATWAALSDGTGRLYLLRTSMRRESSNQWEPLFSESLGDPFIILHSLSHVQAGVHSLEVLLLRLQKDVEEDRGSGYSVSLEWVTVSSLAEQGKEKGYEVKKRRVLQGKTVPHYAAVEPQGKGLMVLSEKPFVLTHVDGEPVERPATAEAMEVETTDPIYFWQQSEAAITLSVRIPEGVTKDAVNFQLTADSVSVGVRGHGPLLEGQLEAGVDPETSTWTLGDGRSLEVTLQKGVPGPMWTELVLGDRRGEFLVSEEQAARLNERLSYLTTEDLNADPEKDKPPCNSQELEDCDGFPEDSTSLVRFDGDTLKPTHVVNLSSHQYLFTVDTNPADMPSFCLRYDVDALLWQPRPEQPADPWEHIATFNALGYVQASKRDKKFATCAPDFSYAALGECLRRVFLYRQPAAIDTVLFNRKQSRQVNQVAKQHVVSLESNDTVLGFRATNERLFVLTANNLFILKVNN